MPEQRPRHYEPLLIGLLSLNFGILFFDRNALNFLMPFVQPDLGLTNTQIGLIASVFSLTWAIAGLVIGSVSDRTGMRKPILVVVTFGFALCSVFSGLVATFAALFLTRLLMGVLEGGVLPISQSLTVIEVAPARRGLAMGFMQNFGSNLLGSTAASIILIAVATRFGWRNAFYLAAIPAVASALLIWHFVREPPREASVPGAPAARLSLRQALAQRNVFICVLISILMVSTLVICFAFMPLFLIQVRKLDPGAMGWLIGTLGVSAGVAGFVVPGISDWVGRKPAMALAPLFGVVAPLGALYFQGSIWGLAVLFFVGWTAIGTFPLFMATIPSEAIDSRHTATVLGLIMGVGEGVGGVLSPTLAGAAADHFGLQAPLWIMTVLPILAGLLALGLKETAPRRLGVLQSAGSNG
jgi:ACS family hexuronate transporter-like MFS transporter